MYLLCKSKKTMDEIAEILEEEQRLKKQDHEIALEDDI